VKLLLLSDNALCFHCSRNDVSFANKITAQPHHT